MNLFKASEENNLPFYFPKIDGYSSRWNDRLNGFSITVPNGELFYAENFFNKTISDSSLEYFLKNNSNDGANTNWNELDKEKLANVDFKNINWRHDKIKIYGREHYLPRYTAWYGDNDIEYTYSGITLQPEIWNKGLLFIKNKIEEVANVEFNSVLMNWYRNGNDHISWHSDAEKELGKNPVIASVNFGETRRFLIRRNDDPKIKLEFPLSHGTLLIMKGELQHFWKHSIPKQKGITKTRINLTFRKIHI